MSCCKYTNLHSTKGNVQKFYYYTITKLYSFTNFTGNLDILFRPDYEKNITSIGVYTKIL